METRKKEKEGKKQVSETPLMKQYNAIKEKHPDALLLFRVGDFYETFGEDAIKASRILGIVLTRRANGAASSVELAGFPHHALDNYLPKLVRAGQRVAICDQLEDPKLTKTIVKRGVTELVTPGVSYNEKVLDTKSNNFLCSVVLQKGLAGVSFLDVSTGEFYCAQGPPDYIEKLVQSFSPNEILFPKPSKKEIIDWIGTSFYTYPLDDWAFDIPSSYEKLIRHFSTNSLKGFGIEGLELGIAASGAALHYLSETQHDKVRHISSIRRIEEDKFVWLDRFTIRNLEIFSSNYGEGNCLLSVIDKTLTPMGSRLLKRWLAFPLKEVEAINERHAVVGYFLENPETATLLRGFLEHFSDLERVASKIATLRISPKELVQLQRSLKSLSEIKTLFLESGNLPLEKIGEQLNGCETVQEKISREVHHDPPYIVAKGNVIASGVSEELDYLRGLAYSGKDFLLKIQKEESERTGIPSLKIAYNSVFGYYLEVTNTHKNKVPSEWIRKQTLTNAERYITPLLKEYEEKILGAESKILELETNLYHNLVVWLGDYIGSLQLNASLVATVDILLGFADLASRNYYTRPEVNQSRILDIHEGRHPVIEVCLPQGESYVSNNVYLDPDQQQIMMITGPNMSGKSALLRQTALIVLLAQIGSYVPARRASIGVIDKIFTRVGASDNITSGESTFMVEMNETASILNNLSDRSLILLDEIGRGTSTYDGISIAWAIAEFLHEHKNFKPKTLFATHYHELNEMAALFPRVRNFNVSVKEIGGKIIFLRKLEEVGSNHSFGIQVARMAGMPSTVIQRAGNMLKQLEASHAGGGIGTGNQNGDSSLQLSFFQLDDPVLSTIKEEIENCDINNLTPVEALNKLSEIKKLVGGNS
jgi:DNA mismatch repair protein MutS